MKYQFVENIAIKPEDIAALRASVGWDQRLEKIKTAASGVYYRCGCFADGMLIGYIEAISDGVDDAYLRNLTVHPHHQGHGIASTLLTMAKERIREDGIKMVNLLFDPKLLPFYRKAGFKIVCGGLIDNEDI